MMIHSESTPPTCTSQRKCCMNTRGQSQRRRRCCASMLYMPKTRRQHPRCYTRNPLSPIHATAKSQLPLPLVATPHVLFLPRFVKEQSWDFNTVTEYLGRISAPDTGPGCFCSLSVYPTCDCRVARGETWRCKHQPMFPGMVCLTTRFESRRRIDRRLQALRSSVSVNEKNGLFELSRAAQLPHKLPLMHL